MAMTPGDVFGSLTVMSVGKGGKHRHAEALCLCACGEQRNVRVDRLRRGEIDRCATCSRKAAWVSRPRADNVQRDIAVRESYYRCNARRRSLVWGLTRNQFKSLTTGSCAYCGSVPALGVDRQINTIGYTTANSVSCCAACNYAKRDMNADDFLAHVAKIAKNRRL